MSSIAELVVRNLPLARGGRVLHSNLSFMVSAGEVLLLKGPNGVGKTSLLRAIAGLLDTPPGCIVFRAPMQGIVAHAEERLGEIGWFGHQDGIKGQLSLRENLLFYRHYNGSRGDVEEALSALGLGHLCDVRAQYLSQGQRRRLAFARLLLTNRSLWLLDEPFSALDDEGRDRIRRHVQDHCAAGGMVVAAAHDALGLEEGSIVLA